MESQENPILSEIFNSELHRRLDAAVKLGHGKLDPFGLSDHHLIETMMRNREAGLSLFEGVKVYRGSKDPDVNSGTFDPAYKHGSASVDVALGYAMTANSHIGLKNKLTHGLGVIAEYDLPNNAVFFRNFGVEDQGTRTAIGINMTQAEELMTPHVDMCLGSTEPDQRDTAILSLRRAAAALLYEVPIPVEQKPTRQWVVQYNDTNHRVVEFQEKGPVADVLIDMVRARKCMVDAHQVEPFTRHSAAAALSDERAQLEAFSPGMVAACGQVASELTERLIKLQQEAFEAPLYSVSDAIAWRKNEQKDLRLEMLNNSGFVIGHVRTDLASADVLEPALQSVERAARLQPRVEALSQLKTTVGAALNISARTDKLRITLREISAKEGKEKETFNVTREKRDVLESDLSDAYMAHDLRGQGNPLRRVLYRLRGQKEALENIGTLQARHAEVEATLQFSSQTLDALQSEKMAGLKELDVLNSDLASYDTQIAAKLNEGTLGLSAQHLPANGVLDKDARAYLAKACDKEMKALDAEIANGLAHAEVFKAVVKKGIQNPVANAIAGIDQKCITSAVELAAAREGLELSSTNGLSTGQGSSDRKIVGRVAHVDAVTNVAILDVGRGTATVVPLSALPARSSVGANVKLQVRDGAIRVLNQALANSASMAHER
jgi:hypothetical protein